METKFGGFEHHISTYIIGLENSFRGKDLVHQLTDASIPFERVEGVVGNFLDIPIENFADQSGAMTVIGRRLTPGEIGCALAHHSIYMRMASTTHPNWSLVLEDDARLLRPEDISVLFDEVMKLPTVTPTVLCLNAGTLLLEKTLINLPSGVDISELMLTPTGTVAYLVNRAASQIFVETALPLVNPADWPQRSEGKIRYLVAFPFIFGHDFAAETTMEVRNSVSSIRPIWERVTDRMTKLLCISWISHKSVWGGLHAYWRKTNVTFFANTLIRGRITQFVPENEAPAFAPIWAKALLRSLGGGCVTATKFGNTKQPE